MPQRGCADKLFLVAHPRIRTDVLDIVNRSAHAKIKNVQKRLLATVEEYNLEDGTERVTD